MKLDVSVNEVVLCNTGTKGEFKIRNSAKAFKILSSGLYSNTIKAIVRELACNAVDSHVAAGKPDVPFVVHLPTVFEPYFAVQDFGVGLDGDQIDNIYTTYFESTKTDSNDYIGALGLGSKSPFSYTENFTVTAIKNGTKRIYSAYINENGLPHVAQMSEDPTEEGNGVEVKFSVTDKRDYNTFRNEANSVFKWFKNKPTITGVIDFRFDIIHYIEMNIIPGVHYASPSSADYNGSLALMGNIAYPLRSIPEPEKHFGACAGLLKCGLIIEFPIGALDFAASREELTFIPLTIRSIKEKLDKLNVNLLSQLTAKANVITNEWERKIFLADQSDHALYKPAVIQYVTDTKFNLYNLGRHHGSNEFDFVLTELASRKLTMQGALVSSASSSTTKRTSIYKNNTYVSAFRVHVDQNTVFVLNDLKSGCAARAKFHYSTEAGRTTVICVNHSSPDLDERQAEYDKLMAELHNPPVIVKASSLRSKPRTESSVKYGIAVIELKQARHRYSSLPDTLYKWVPTDELLDEDETYYYIGLSGHTAIDKLNAEYPIFEVKEKMDKCGRTNISNIQIYGVRRSKIKEIEKLGNWVNILDKLKEETSKITDNDISDMIVGSMLDTPRFRVYTNKNVAKIVSIDSPYSKFVAKYCMSKTPTGNVRDLVSLCNTFSKTVQIDMVTANINLAKEVVIRKYPMLNYSTGASDVEIAEYVTMIDKQENNT